MENDYIRVIVLPELGGRIYEGYDKVNDYNFVYKNQVIKPALIGLNGAWISGGIEFNWPQHHRPSTYEAADYYYEENTLHSCILSLLKDLDELIIEIDKFLPYIDNWATCDMVRPKVFKKHLPELFNKVKIWISLEQTYTIRYGSGMLLSYYLDERFEEKHLQISNIAIEYE